MSGLINMLLLLATIAAVVVVVGWLEYKLIASMDAEDARYAAQRRAEAELVESDVAGLWVNRAYTGAPPHPGHVPPRALPRRPAAPTPIEEYRGKPWA